MVCRVSDPTPSEVLSAGDSTTVSCRFIGSGSVVTHVEEERAIREFCDCAFSGVVPSVARDLPGFPMILGPSDIGKGKTFGVATLGGYHEGAVFHSDAISRRGGEEMPGRIFEFIGPVLGLGPGGPVIGGSDDYELSGFMDVEAGFGAIATPLVCAWFAVGPACCNEDFTGLFVDENTGVGAAVLVLRLSPVLGHVHNGFWG